MSKPQFKPMASDAAIVPSLIRSACYVLQTPAVAHPPDQIVVEHCQAPDRGRQPYTEIIPAGRCRMTIALRRGYARVHRNGRLMHEGQVYPGMVRMSQPGDRIEGEVFSAAEAVSIDLPDNRLTGWRTSAVQVRPILRPDARTEQLGRMLIDVTHAEDRHRALFGQGVIDALLAIVLDYHGREQPERPANSGLATAELQRVLDYAEANIGQPPGLSDCAGVIGLSVQEFARRFRSTTGSAPYAYFLRRRVERAKEMLTQTDLRLVDIALETGFGSQSHFNETFRRIVGVSPGQWRRRG